jgi:Tol biopolymer transport system component
MGSKSPPMILVMVGTLVCAAIIISAAAGALLPLLSPSSVFAQQEETSSLGEEEGEDTAGDIVSGVLDSVNDNEDEEEDNGAAAEEHDDSNRQLAAPITGQDQGSANLALNEALDGTVERRLTREPTPPPPGNVQEPYCSLEITTDKEIYGPGDVIAITIRNTGDVPLDFPNSALGLQIKNVDTGEVFPLEAAQVITTLESGESRTFEFTYEELVSEIGTGLISATVASECTGVKEVTFSLSETISPHEEDTTPPRLRVPEDITQEATSSDGAEISFEVSAEDDVDGTVLVECTPASGSIFPIGVTTVECTATDAAGNIGRGSFTVTVSPAPEEIAEKIAFVSTGGDEYWDIYVMNPDGSGVTRLTTPTEYDYIPYWSPDGTKILFSARDYVGGVIRNTEIYVMNADGSGVTNLSNNPADDTYPVWSPDGRKIAFVSDRLASIAGEEIYVMNADGSGVTRLNDRPNNSSPRWSPDGTKIAFSAYINNNLDIYVMNSDGSGVTRLTSHNGCDTYPDWSPDGTKIAYSRDLDCNGNNYEVYVMDADMGDEGTVTNLSNNPAWDSHPSWSPDGTKIAFMSFRDGRCCGEIYVMNADGSGQTRLTNNAYYDFYPDWGPAVDTSP